MNVPWMKIGCHFSALIVGIAAVSSKSWLMMAYAGIFTILAFAARFLSEHESKKVRKYLNQNYNVLSEKYRRMRWAQH